MSCPSGFEEGLSNTCRVVCPPDYKYIQDAGVELCVSAANNNYLVQLQAIPKGSSMTAFSEEQSRFLTEFIKLTKKVKKDQDALREATNNDVVAHHETIRSTNGLAGAYTEAIETLKPLRPPTQPHEDIMLAKLSIRELSEQDVRAVQICLFFVIIALFEYLLLPASFVHGVAFFTMCVGFSLAIYLRNR